MKNLYNSKLSYTLLSPFIIYNYWWKNKSAKRQRMREHIHHTLQINIKIHLLYFLRSKLFQMSCVIKTRMATSIKIKLIKSDRQNLIKEMSRLLNEPFHIFKNNDTMINFIMKKYKIFNKRTNSILTINLLLYELFLIVSGIEELSLKFIRAFQHA